MKITRDWILANRSSKNGWYYSQIALLGETWPPHKGWMDRAVGREIPDEDAARFVAYGKARPSKGERKKIKQELKKKQAEKCRVKPTVKPADSDFRASDAFLRSYEWRRVRMEALKMHGTRCLCCGASPSTGAVMHVDHIKPRRIYPELALDVTNLQVLCEECNHGKGNWDMTDWREHMNSIMRE